MNASRNPLDAMYIKASQPTKRALPAKKTKKRKKGIRKPAQTRPLANACKNKQHIHLFKLSRLARALAIKEFR
jgi:hypothetical protein